MLSVGFSCCCAEELFAELQQNESTDIRIMYENLSMAIVLIRDYKCN